MASGCWNGLICPSIHPPRPIHRPLAAINFKSVLLSGYCPVRKSSAAFLTTAINSVEWKLGTKFSKNSDYLRGFVTVNCQRINRTEYSPFSSFVQMAPFSPLSPLDGCLSWSAGPLPPEACFYDKIIHESANVNGIGCEKKRLLCLSNGHGEDAIAVAILKELQVLAAEKGEKLIVDGYPLVGLGNAYVRAGIRTLGPVKEMPSGGFIYMDSWQLVKDVKAGLIDLLVEQWRTIARWVKKYPTGAVIAVGDAFPLAMTWLAERHRKLVHKSQSTAGYGFVGTAKSEYYLRDEAGNPLLAQKRNMVESLISPKGVYLPWERALMVSESCRLVVPRDRLTVQMLQNELPASTHSKVLDLGNPMMDGLEATGALDSFLESHPCDHCLALLPGTRQPEAFGNWSILLECVKETVKALAPKRCMFLVPLVPLLPLGPFTAALEEQGWCLLSEDSDPTQISVLKTFLDISGSGGGLVTDVPKPVQKETINSKKNTKTRDQDQWPEGNGSAPKIVYRLKGDFLEGMSNNAAAPMLVLVKGCFSDCAQRAEGGIAMAGTGTEQLVGLGKPAFTLPGKGPQFTWAFAEAQSRLLGKSAVLSSDPHSLAESVPRVLADKALLAEMVKNGRVRLGEPGAGRRIAESIWEHFLEGEVS